MERGVAPAMVLLLSGPGGQTVYCAGDADEDTIFDLASLTKPLATALLALDLEDKDILPWQSTLQQIWGPAVPVDKREISLYQLLTHSSGFPAYEHYYKALHKTPPALRGALLQAMLMNQPLESRPGQSARYSDLGYMLLGLAMEHTLEQPLDKALKRLYEGLGLQGPRFLPLGRPLPWPPGKIAPCGPLPGRETVHGQSWRMKTPMPWAEWPAMPGCSAAPGRWRRSCGP